jgi:hypothetical protein
VSVNIFFLELTQLVVADLREAPEALPGFPLRKGFAFPPPTRPASIRMYKSLPDCQLLFCSAEGKDVGMQLARTKPAIPSY